jgi:phosphoglycerate dehydrogenase-like enzyme
LFSSLSKAEAKRVAGITDEVNVREGAELLQQGNSAHELMVIEPTPMTLMVMTARDLRAIAREMPGLENCLRTAAATRLPVTD